MPPSSDQPALCEAEPDGTDGVVEGQDAAPAIVHPDRIARLRLPQGEMQVVQEVGLLGGAGPTRSRGVEVLAIIEEGVEAFQRIGGVGVLIHHPGHRVDRVRQPGGGCEPQRGVVGQVQRAGADAEGVVEEVGPGAGEGIDIHIVADVEVTDHELVLATLELLIPQ